MEIDRNATRTGTYWQLESAAYSDASPAEAASGFRQLLGEAVRREVGTDRRLGIQLSGGLDSSAVALLAAQSESASVHALSNRFETVVECDEGDYIRQVRSLMTAPGYERIADERSPLQTFLEWSPRWELPSVVPNLYLIDALSYLAAEHDLTAMLTGLDGDTIVSHGLNGLVDLARAGEWKAFAAEVVALEHRHYSNSDQLYRTYGAPELGGRVRSGHLPSTFTAIKTLRRDGVSRRLFRQAIRAGFSVIGQQAPIEPSLRLLRGETVARLELDSPQASSSSMSELEVQRRRLGAAPYAKGLEMLHTIEAATGVEARHPFFDRRLAEFCLSLPPEAKLRDGWTRRVLRDALADVYPEGIRWRETKADLTPAFLRGFLRQDAALLKHAVGKPIERLGSLVDPAVVRSAVERLINSERAQLDEVYAVWRIATAAIWMEAHDLGLA
jgi:asparagine synthase (glutamine-hydrolysing)